MPVSAFILSLFHPLWDLKSIHYIRKFFITNFVIMIKSLQGFDKNFAADSRKLCYIQVRDKPVVLYDL